MKINEVEATPVYISRPLLNGKELKEWAETQGFESTLDSDDMHVTVVYSSTAFTPSEVYGGEIVIPASEDRHIEALGDEGAMVLKFDSEELQQEWQQYQDMGASHDFDDYVTHVTITYDGDDIDTGQMSPFSQELRFGAGKAKPLKSD